MAEKKTEAPVEEGAPKSKKKLLMFIIIGVVALVLIAGGVAAYLMMKSKAAAEEGDGEDTAHVEKGKAQKKEKDAHAVAPTFYKFDKPFTVKLVSAEAENYLQTEVQLKLIDAPTAETLKAYDPELKHKITLLLLGKTAAELATAAGVQTLSNQIRDTVNLTLENEPGPAPGAVPAAQADPEAAVQSVLFTTFIIQ